MANKKQIQQYTYAAFFFGCMIFAYSARVLPGPRTIDDSYITFRYSRNILAGNGFVYNPGERVLGTTTPLFTFLLTGLGALSGGTEAPFPEIAQLVNALADAITCVILFLIGQRLKHTWAGTGAALVWALAPFSVTFAIGGLETSVYVLLLTALMYAHLTRHRTLTALLGALALLTRPDALILLGPVILDRLRSAVNLKSKKSSLFPGSDPLRILELAAFLLPITAWVIFSSAYFGGPLPHSLAAKSVAYRLGPLEGFIRLLQHYATPFLGHKTFGIPWIGVGLVLYPFLFLMGGRRLLKQDHHLWPWLAYPWLYFAAFAIANPLIFRWYLTPPLPTYIFAILAGTENIIQDIFRKKASQWKTPALIVFIIGFPLLLTLRGWVLTPDHGLTRPAPEMAYYQLELLYQEAAELLNPELHKHENLPVLAAGDVGVLGYETNARILDTVGLNTPESSTYYPAAPDLYVINYAIPPELILENSPDYIVILEVYGRAGLLIDSDFQSKYELLHSIPTEIYGSRGMLIFRQIE